MVQTAESKCKKVEVGEHVNRHFLLSVYASQPFFSPISPVNGVVRGDDPFTKHEGQQHDTSSYDHLGLWSVVQTPHTWKAKKLSDKQYVYTTSLKIAYM